MEPEASLRTPRLTVAPRATSTFSADQEAVLGLLRRHGWNSTSFQVLEPGYTYWFAADGEGAIAYLDTGRYRVAAGAPISPTLSLASHAQAFSEDSARHGKRVCFFGAGRRLIDALEMAGVRNTDWLQMGIEANWDPQDWDQVLASSSQVPAQVRRAIRKGVQIREAAAEELDEGKDVRRQAEVLADRWLARQPMAPLQFLALLDPFSRPQERRYFVAERGGLLIGMLVAIPIFDRSGWLLEDLLSHPGLPNGTGEALIDFSMRALRDSGARFASLGMVALAGLPDQPEAPRHPVLTSMLNRCHDTLNWLYGFRGLHAFRAKFKPRTWEPVYLVTLGPLNINTVLSVLKAFAGGRLRRFAVATAGKRLSAWGAMVPPVVWWGTATFLAAALVPWIVLLVTCDSRHWFGSEWAGMAWASFDMGVAAAFGTLAHYLRRGDLRARGLARTLLGATLADSWLTAAQTLLYSFPQARTAVDVAVACVATAAPLFASGYLALLILSESSRDPA